MKVSWIDPDTFRSLADSLLEPEQRQEAANESPSSSEIRSDSLQDASGTSGAEEIPELHISAENLQAWDEEEAPYMPDAENLEQIRRRLENLSDRASNAGIIRDTPFEEEDASALEEPDTIPPAAAQELREVETTFHVDHSPAMPEHVEVLPSSPMQEASVKEESESPETSLDLPKAPELEANLNPQVGLQDIKNLVFGIAPGLPQIPIPGANEPSFDEAALQLPEWPAQDEPAEPAAFTPKPPPVDLPPLAFDGVVPTHPEDPSPNAFTPIEADLAARLDHYVSWASHLTGALEALILDQHGDLIWGNGRCSDLVASSILAINTQWRSSALNLAQRYPHLNMRLNEKRVLAILPCTTRFGQITLGLVLTEAMEASKAAELAEALITTVNQA